MSTFNYSLKQLSDSKTYTHIQLPIKNDSSDGKIGLVQDIDIGVMKGFGYTTNEYDSDTSIDRFESFVRTIDLLFKNLDNRISNLKSIVDGLTTSSLIASITTEPQAKTLTYNGTNQYLIQGGTANNGVMQYSLTDSSNSYSTALPQGTNAGTYTIYYYAQGTNGYNDSTKGQLEVTIAKDSSIRTMPTAKFTSIPCDDSFHDLINPGTTNSGTMEYGVNFNNSSQTTAPTSWSSNIPQGMNVGQYHIWYRIVNGVDANHKEENATYLTSVTISERAVQQYTVRLIINTGNTRYGEYTQTVNSGSSASWPMGQAPSGYNWPTSVNNGTIKIINGNATITSNTVNGEMTVVVNCQSAYISVTSISLDKSSLTINANSTCTIKATVSPSNATSKTIIWYSSDTSVAVVTNSTESGNNATVAWKKAGTCEITATANNEGIYKKCQVTCEAASDPEVQNYFYVGTVKPKEDDIYTVTSYPIGYDIYTVTSYPTEQTYKNNSGTKSHIFVLTNSDKNVTFIEPSENSPITQVDVDTTTISGYKIFETAVGVANAKSIKIIIS